MKFNIGDQVKVVVNPLIRDNIASRIKGIYRITECKKYGQYYFYILENNGRHLFNEDWLEKA